MKLREHFVQQAIRQFKGNLLLTMDKKRKVHEKMRKLMPWPGTGAMAEDI